MERWATHAAAAEGRPWVAAGLLVAAGALSSALLLLREHGLPDAAAALTAACKEAELPLLADGDGGGELGNVFGKAGLATPRFDSGGLRAGGGSKQLLSRCSWAVVKWLFSKVMLQKVTA